MPSIYSPIPGPEPSLEPHQQYDLESMDADGNRRSRSRSRVSSIDEDQGSSSITKNHPAGNQHQNATRPHTSTFRLDSQLPLVPGSSSHPYTFERYMYRSTLNTLGPAVVTAFYLFIVFAYLLHPGENDIIPSYPISARKIFFAWLILSIFVLDWAKSGLAGFEAAALMKPHLAPSNAMQLMWHTDRTWGSISGWWKALMEVWSWFKHKMMFQPHRHDWKGPSTLWWYLALSSFVLYVGIPLAGLSMDPTDGFKLTGRSITILGANETSFNNQLSNAITNQASSRWRQGNPTSPQGETIFYAPDGTKNVSSTFYEDCIQGIFQGNRSEECASNNSVTFFSGPQVSERAHGTAWGILTTVSCSVAHPYLGLDLLDVKSINNWTAQTPSLGFIGSSNQYGNNYSTAIEALNSAGTSPVLFYIDEFLGVSYQYLIASDNDIEGNTITSYTPPNTLPLPGSLELVMWQGYSDSFKPDATFEALSSHPSVVSSTSPLTNITYLGYAVRCTLSSDVGFADLDATTRTFSNFKRKAPDPFAENLSNTLLPITQAPGVQAIQSLVFGAFTSVNLGYFGAPLCMPGTSVGCNSWYSSSLAAGSVPFFNPTGEFKFKGKDEAQGFLAYPTLTPERMTLAMYKLFGEAAIAMMSFGPEPYEAGLKGLEAATGLVPGVIPWLVVLPLLCVWTFITVLPNCWTFAERRWAGTLDGFEMFRLGAEWRDVVWRFEGTEAKENEDVLKGVPGMLGNMEPGGKRGFVGLSDRVAQANGEYGYNRANLGG